MAAPALPQAPEQLSFQDYLGLNAALFEWAESYDSKDWDRLSRACTPQLHIDYTSFLSYHNPSLPLDSYLSMISSQTVLGSPLLKTQHFIGASRWELTSPGKAMGYHQLRVPHQKYLGDGKGGLGEVDFKGHAHGSNVHWYEKVDGQWRFAGLKPEIRWGEFDFERIFETGRGEHGTAADGNEQGKNVKARDEEHKIEAGKIMGGIDATSTEATPTGHVNGDTTTTTPAQEPPQATAGANTVVSPPLQEPSSTFTHAPASSFSPLASTAAAPASRSASSSVSSSYQAETIQERKDRLYEQAEAVAAAEEVQMYAGAMADGLDHLGTVGAAGKAVEVAGGGVGVAV